MSEQCKERRFFQIHLSTAIVLMFVANALLGANCIPITLTVGEMGQANLNYAFRMAQGVGVDQSRTFVHRCQGWPFWFRSRIVDETGTIMPYYSWANTLSFEWLAADVLIAIVLCGAAVEISERFFRRREVRKP